MKKRFDKLTQTTGASGEMSELDKLVLRVMKKDKDIVGDTVGSSSSNEGVDVRGAHVFYSK